MKEIIKKNIKKILNLFGLEFKFSGKLYVNVFKKNYNRHVLVSYVTKPFIEKNAKLSHTNLLECFAAADFFDRNGYVVDVIDFKSSRDIDYSKYEIIYGFGIPFENYFLKASNLNIKTIFYLTGFNPEISNVLTVERAIEVFLKVNKIFPNSSRVVNFNSFYSLRLSNYLLVLGDQATLESCSSLKRKEVHSIKSFFINANNKIEINKKNFNIARRNFLWFGSHGAIHKGLDILIEIFKERPDCNLHICGLQELEYDFFTAILDREDFPNIINHGFIDINSEKFSNLMQECAFCVFPSISEGGSPSLLTVIANGGLIPVFSSNCGVDGLEKDGFVTSIVSKSEFDRLISEVLLLDVKELQLRSESIRQFVSNEFTYDRYVEKLNNLLAYFTNECK